MVEYTWWTTYCGLHTVNYTRWTTHGGLHTVDTWWTTRWTAHGGVYGGLPIVENTVLTVLNTVEYMVNYTWWSTRLTTHGREHILDSVKHGGVF